VGAGETLPSGEHPAQSHAHPGPLVRVGLVEVARFLSVEAILNKFVDSCSL
jgi:hypothetical protein